MNERHLIIISTMMFILGSSVMLLVSLTDPQSYSIESLGKDMVGDFVSVEGAVDSPRITNGHTFFKIRQGSQTIDSVIFNEEEKLKIGQEIKVKAEISMYKGKMELIVESYDFL